MAFSLLVYFFILILPFLFFIFFKHTTQIPKNLPPGPHPWPLIGNILHVANSKPHVSLSHLSQTHGPLISLKLGSRLLIAASSAAAAAEVLKTHDRHLSGRYLPKLALPELQQHSLVWAPHCSENWKNLRSLCRNELFSVTSMESQRPIRERKVAEMVKFVGKNEGNALNLGEIVFATFFNMMGNLLFSRDLINLGEKDEKEGLKGIIWEMMEMGGSPNVSDFFPVLERFDLQGLKKKFMGLVKELFAVWEIIVRERRENREAIDDRHQDFLDVMIDSGFSDIQIHVLALELFSAGTESTTSTIEWTMSELLKNKQYMTEIRHELQRELGSKTIINESQTSQLPYLNACVKEALRLHPTVPFLIPHYALETCKVMGYTVPKDSQVIVNLWAIGRDPVTWKDPLSFKPERFLDSNVDFKGQDFEFLPFGAGRRMCPGMPLACKQVNFILGSLLHEFEWFLPHGEIDMSEKFGITLRKEQPLVVIPKMRK